MEVTKPIIIFGCGRSGTTIFHRMFSSHPRVAWLSNLCNKHPDKPWLNWLLMNALEVPMLNNGLRQRTYVHECYKFWEYYCKGFSNPCRDLLPTDVTIKNKTQIHSIMSKMVTASKNRLLIKITGWPRLGFLTEVFEDARFIHVVRDGRAVANSLLNVGWWQGWTGPQNWRLGPLPPIYEEEWNKYDKSFVVLAAIQWKILMDAAEQARKYVKDDNLLEIKYEQLCCDPVGTFKRVTERADLEWTNGFEKDICQYKLRNTNNKWEKELNADQQKALNEVLQDYLSRHGYL